MNMLVTTREDGRVVHKGDEVIDFRGTPATFVQATRPRVPGKSGKVLVERDGRKTEFYDGVFGLAVLSIDGDAEDEVLVAWLERRAEQS